MNWIELVGYVASAFVVLSFAMSSIVKIRTISLVGSVFYVAYGVLIGLYQMNSFVGNLLELRSGQGSFIFLSETAFGALEPGQRIALEKYAQFVPIAIPTIEAVGGGSVRCMLAENFLPSQI